MKAFVEAVEAFPDVAPGHEKRAGRLFHGAGLIEVAIQIAVAAVDGIGGPQAIDAEQFKDERGGRGQAANGESGLRAVLDVGQVGNLQRDGDPLGRVQGEGRRLATGAQVANLPHIGIKIDKFSGGEPVLLAGVDECVNRGKQIRVWIQQQKEIRLAGGNVLVDSGGESAIFAIRDEVDVCPLADPVERPIAGSIIDDDRFHVGSHPNERVEASADDGFRVEGHDDRGSSQK
jgi:hypothetical protein